MPKAKSYRLLRGREIRDTALACQAKGWARPSGHFNDRMRDREIQLSHVRWLLESPTAKARVTRPMPKQFDGYKAYNYELSGKVDGRRLVIWFHFIDREGSPYLIWGSAAWKDD